MKFSTVICFSIIVYGVLEMLSPKSSTSSAFKKLISIIIIFSVFFSVKSLAKTKFSFLSDLQVDSKISKDVTDSYNKILKEKTERIIAEEVKRTLTEHKFDFSYVTAEVEPNGTETILKEICVYRERSDNQTSLKIQSLLSEMYNINVIVRTIE